MFKLLKDLHGTELHTGSFPFDFDLALRPNDASDGLEIGDVMVVFLTFATGGGMCINDGYSGAHVAT
jgi:hypothetical protein